MAEKSTIARPYAEAIFSLALEGAKLSNWSDMLQLAAAVVADDKMQNIIGNTNVNKDELAQLFIDILGKKLNKQGKNLIKVLAENRRLNFLPEIAEQYEVLRADQEKTVEAEVISAFKVSGEQQQQIAEKLKARLGREVSLTCTVDESLIGGMVIKAGDMVIDGSAVGQIQKLSIELAG